MSSIRHMLTASELERLSKQDHTYLKQQLKHRTLLARILNRPVNQHLLTELQRLLDKEPLPRQHAGQVVRGQVSRLTDGVRRPCTVRKMTVEECIRYGVDPAVLNRSK